MATPAVPLSYITATATATIGNANAPVKFAGLAPGFAGLYQVNILVPPMEDGDFRVSSIRDCVSVAPEIVDLRLTLSRLLLELKRNKDAYDAALDALPLVAAMTDRKEASAIEEQLAICADNAAMEKAAVVCRDTPGRTLEEVARATSSTVGAVKQKAHRAYAKLR